jgi:glucose/arabinose dehydrogenase
MPDVAYGGQGGLGDVAIHPKFAQNHWIYLSYAESGVGNVRGAAVARAVLNETPRGGRLTDFEVIWRQYPKVVGYGHYGHRLLFDDQGYLWIASGDRRNSAAQDMQANLEGSAPADDGSVPDDNPSSLFDENPLVDDEESMASGRSATVTCSASPSDSTVSSWKSNGAEGRRRAEPDQEELRLPHRLERRPLRRSVIPTTTRTGIRETSRVVDPGHLPRT